MSHFIHYLENNIVKSGLHRGAQIELLRRSMKAKQRHLYAFHQSDGGISFKFRVLNLVHGNEIQTQVANSRQDPM